MDEHQKYSFSVEKEVSDSLQEVYQLQRKTLRLSHRSPRERLKESSDHNIRSSCLCRMSSQLCYILFIISIFGLGVETSSAFNNVQMPANYDDWKHQAALDADKDFIAQWTPAKDHIIFRVTVRTRGYIGFGLSKSPRMNGADIVVGWVHSGKAYLQDRHGVGNQEPAVDSQQDWTLVHGNENDTHTSLIMSRPYYTCDKEDHDITNDTTHLLWAFHPDDPVNPENPRPRIHYHGWRKGVAPMFLLERGSLDIPTNLLPYNAHSSSYSQKFTWELRNAEVRVTSSTDTMYWCKLFKRPHLKHKHHVVKYEPVFSGSNERFVHHMIIYECTNLEAELEAVLDQLSLQPGQECYQSNMSHLNYNCNHVVAAWATGSLGLALPSEAGYPLTPDGPKFYMMETHYDNPPIGTTFVDSSGIRMIYTSELRLNDAGVLSLGLEPNWKHLIPPRQRTVISEGHCVPECTETAFPPSGIYIFGTILHTHLLGRRVRVRHLRYNQELPHIAVDNNYDSSYQEYRQLQEPRHVRSGDHLVVECLYNSLERSTITLGGFKTRDEMCLSFLFYWPRVDISFCHSKPSLATVLHSLGIEELAEETAPIKIRRPIELAGKTLEWRLMNYNWNQNFNYFQQTTSAGTFNAMCHRRGESILPELEKRDYAYPNITKPWSLPKICKRQRNNHRHKNKNRKSPSLLEDQLSDENKEVMFDDDTNDKPIERIDVDPFSRMDLILPIVKDQFEETEGDILILDKENHGQITTVIDPMLREELEEMERDFAEEVHQMHNNRDKEQSRGTFVKTQNVKPIDSGGSKIALNYIIVLLVVILHLSGIRWTMV